METIVPFEILLIGLKSFVHVGRFVECDDLVVIKMNLFEKFKKIGDMEILD